MTDDATLAVYDARSADYAEMVGAWEAPGLDTFIAALSPGDRVLDLGCGPGLDAARMAAAGLDVLAVDGSAKMVALAASRPGVTARQAMFDEVPALGRFAGVWASFSLLHLPRAVFPARLAEIRAACLPLARFTIGMKLGSGEATDRLGRFYSYYTEDELRDHLSAAGFTPGTAILGTGEGLSGDPSEWIVLAASA